LAAKEKIAIIGIGLIGGSLAKAIKKTDASIKISAYDQPDILTLAQADESIDIKLNSHEEALDSDIIFICLPVDESIKVFEKFLPLLKENQIISDVCSVKKVFNDIWDKSGSQGIYIGGHPMTGKEKSGYENSDSLLFENSIYILTDCSNSETHTKRISQLIESIGARVTFVDADTHDKIVAEVSHLPQLVATSLVNTVTNHADLNILSFAAGGFRDMTRIASSPFAIWEPIIRKNKEKILNALANLKQELDLIEESIRKDEYKDLAEKFETARIRRNVIPKNTKGFISQLYDVFIFVKDQPGEMSLVSTALYKANINIKDIEVLKMREGTGGTFRLAFDNQTDASRAKKIIEALGFSTKI
jgi:prephenate dehydrogenase